MSRSALKRKRHEREITIQDKHGWLPIETAPRREYVLISHGITSMTPVFSTTIARQYMGEWYGQEGQPISGMVPKYWQPLPSLIG